MTNNPREELDDVLGPAVEQLKNSGASSHLPDDLNAQVLELLGKQTETESSVDVARSAKSNRSPKGNRMMMLLKYGIAASILAVVGFALNLPGLPTGPKTAFAQVAERIAEIRSLTCRVQFIDDEHVETANPKDGTKLSYLAPSKQRIDDPIGTTQIVDVAEDTSLYLNHVKREALTIHGGMALATVPVSPVRLVDAVQQHFHLDRIASDDIESIDPRTIDGTDTIGFRSTLNGEVVEAWFDQTTHLPKLIRVKFAIASFSEGEPEANLWRVVTDLKFDAEVDEQLFSMEVPEGYKSVTMDTPKVNPTAMKPATVDDLIEMLQFCAVQSEGVFPLSVSPSDESGTAMAVQSQFVKSLEDQFENGSESEKNAAMQQVVETGTLFGKGNAFLFTMKAENKFEYFGGASLEDNDRPLLWYLPDGSDKYTVVFADLSIEQLSLDDLPAKPIVPKGATDPPTMPLTMPPTMPPTEEVNPEGVGKIQSSN